MTLYRCAVSHGTFDPQRYTHTRLAHWPWSNCASDWLNRSPWLATGGHKLTRKINSRPGHGRWTISCALSLEPSQTFETLVEAQDKPRALYVNTLECAASPSARSQHNVRWKGMQNCQLHYKYYMSCFPLPLKNHNSRQIVCLLWGKNSMLELSITDISVFCVLHYTLCLLNQI